MNETGRRGRPAGAGMLVLGLVLSLVPAAQSAPGDPRVVEEGKYVLHKFENPIGEETYRILRTGDALTVEMDFAFTDRGTRVPLTATFRSDTALQPRSFSIQGKPSRQASLAFTAAAMTPMIAPPAMRPLAMRTPRFSRALASASLVPGLARFTRCARRHRREPLQETGYGHD